MTRNRRRLRLTALASLTTVALALVVNAADDVRSPFDEASAIQRQMRGVVDRAARSTFAVTAFATTPIDSALWQSNLDPETFATFAEKADRSCGTAFAIDREGTLLTSEHVIAGATSVWITSDDGRVLPALVVGSDPRSDLAVLRVPGATTPIAIGGDVDPARGDVVVTLGNPAGLATGGAVSASVGAISATHRALPALSAKEKRFYDDLLQVTTPLATGNSGGPLVDLAGRAIGIMCATVDGSGHSASIGFAVALTPTIRVRVERIARGEEIVYAYVGVACGPTDDAAHVVGARINRVDASAPAAGVLMPGDVIQTFDGASVDGDATFSRLASATAVDRDVPVTVLRDGKSIALTIRPRKREPNATPVTTATQRLDWGGATFANGERGVAVTAVVDGVGTPLKVGQVVRAIDGKPTPTLVELLAALHAGGAMTIELLEGVTP